MKGPRFTTKILEFQVINQCPELILMDILESIKKVKRGMTILCANSYTLALSKRDKQLRDALTSASWLLPDGAGIVLASKITTNSIKQRITGYDIFVGLAKKLNNTNFSSFFLVGTDQNTLSLIKKKMHSEYPNLEVHTLAPPFKDELSVQDSQKIINEINKINPTVVWVAMSAPKQEKWIYRYKDYLNTPIIAAVGATFDFYVGKQKRAPKVIQKVYFEWLWRLIANPRRLWRRTFIFAPIFIKEIIQDRFFNHENK